MRKYLWFNFGAKPQLCEKAMHKWDQSTNRRQVKKLTQSNYTFNLKSDVCGIHISLNDCDFHASLTSLDGCDILVCLGD
jgi:hypothetical protein